MVGEKLKKREWAFSDVSPSSQYGHANVYLHTERRPVKREKHIGAVCIPSRDLFFFFFLFLFKNIKDDDDDVLLLLWPFISIEDKIEGDGEYKKKS